MMVKTPIDFRIGRILMSWGLTVLASFKEQFRRNIVAIISLVLAIVSLSYNTWRNERTEDNRNIRDAGFEILVTLGELHEIVFFLHYDRDEQRGNPRRGWAKVLLIDDLATIMSPEVVAASEMLTTTWGKDWAALGADEFAVQRVSDAVDEVRYATLQKLSVLK
ncbi:MAG: hypothetical protein ACNA8J_09725 [Gammaproteobacteria bacterium]